VISTGFSANPIPLNDDWPRPSEHVRDLAPYDGVSSLTEIEKLPDGVVPLKLDWNEATIPPSPKVAEAIAAYLGDSQHLNWYPDTTSTRLREALSRYTGVPADHIVPTNGSDDSLDLVCRAFLDPTDDMIVAWPTYGHMLVFSRARGITPRRAQPADIFDTPTATIRSMLTPRTKLVYIASPNNPTGVVMPTQDVASLCRSAPTTLFLLDEAYHEFCGITAAPLVEEFPNLVVTRTFSKCFALASLRIGYMMAGPVVLHHIRKLHNPKSINAVGQLAAAAAVSDDAYRLAYVREVDASKALLQRELARRGARVRVTPANWVLVSLAEPGRFTAALESVGVFVRDRSHIAGFGGYVRITAGTLAQMQDLMGRIDRLMAERPELLAPPAS
jgi:histidinol-phosphate aminotransferase